VGGAFHDQDTKPYTSQDFRFTRKGNVLYAIGMGCPADGATGGSGTIHALGSAKEAAGLTLTSVELVGSQEKVNWLQMPEALNVKLPAGAACKYAYVLRIGVSEGAK